MCTYTSELMPLKKLYAGDMDSTLTPKIYCSIKHTQHIIPDAVCIASVPVEEVAALWKANFGDGKDHIILSEGVLSFSRPQLQNLRWRVLPLFAQEPSFIPLHCYTHPDKSSTCFGMSTGVCYEGQVNICTQCFRHCSVILVFIRYKIWKDTTQVQTYQLLNILGNSVSGFPALPGN